jgi:hypothetical protein
VGRLQSLRQHAVAHAAHRLPRARRRFAGSLLRPTRVRAHARGVSHRAVSPAWRRARCLDRAGAARSQREDAGRCVQGRGVRHGLLRQMAQRQSVALSPDGARLRRILRPHLGALGRVLRRAARGERAHDSHDRVTSWMSARIARSPSSKNTGRSHSFATCRSPRRTRPGPRRSRTGSGSRTSPSPSAPPMPAGKPSTRRAARSR